MSRLRFDSFDAANLVAAMFGLPEPEDDAGIEQAQDRLIEQFGIDLDALASMAELLVPLCACDRSPLTNLFRRGFVRDGAYIVKELIPEAPAVPAS